jgi:hypothetical protein
MQFMQELLNAHFHFAYLHYANISLALFTYILELLKGGVRKKTGSLYNI